MPTAIVCSSSKEWARIVLSPSSWCKRSKVDNACLKSERFLNGWVSEPDLFEMEPPFVLVVEGFFF